MRIILLALAASSLMACSLTSESEDPSRTTEGVATSALEPHFSARAYETSLRVLARFSAEHAANLRLASSDRLVAVIDGGAELPMTESVVDGTLNYVAEVPVPTKSVRVAIRLVRGNGQASAPASEIVLPAPFAIVKAPSTVAVGVPLTVNTSALDGEARLTGQAGCLASAVYDQATPIAGGVHIDSMGGTLATNVNECPVDFELSLDTGGKLDPSYAPGASLLDPSGFVGAQRRSFHATVVR